MEACWGEPEKEVAAKPPVLVWIRRREGWKEGGEGGIVDPDAVADTSVGQRVGKIGIGIGVGIGIAGECDERESWGCGVGGVGGGMGGDGEKGEGRVSGEEEAERARSEAEGGEESVGGGGERVDVKRTQVGRGGSGAR